MFFPGYIDSEFAAYLNRHLKGIVLLRNHLKEIRISYERSAAFSNCACRFTINVEFKDVHQLSKEELCIANQNLHNMWNSTGSQFVSFIYQSQKSIWINFDVIKDFLIHYEFAKTLFEDFVRDILPNECVIRIEPLENEPLFIYADSFLTHLKYSQKKQDKEIEQLYKEIYHRSFEFDWTQHLRIIEAATKFSETKIEKIISEKDILNTMVCNLENLRWFILNNNIPFSIDKYSRTISQLYIDRDKLKETLDSYIPSNPYNEINADGILKVIAQKEKEEKKNKEEFNQLKDQSNIHIGDIIFVERDNYGDQVNTVGIVKQLRLNYNHQLSIQYNPLKNNLEESKLRSKETSIEHISHILTSFKANEEVTVKNKIQLIVLLREKQNVNPLFKKEKVKARKAYK